MKLLFDKKNFAISISEECPLKCPEPGLYNYKLTMQHVVVIFSWVIDQFIDSRDSKSCICTNNAD